MRCSSRDRVHAGEVILSMATHGSHMNCIGYIFFTVFLSLCPFRIPDDSALILMGCFGGTFLKVPCADIIDLQSFQSLKVMENDIKLLAPLFTTRDTP